MTDERGYHWLAFQELVFLPGGLGPRTHLVPKNERAFHAGDDDVGRAVAVQIGDDELRAHARTVVNQLGNQFGAAFSLRIANRPVPVEDGRTVRVGIEVAL